MNNIKAIFFDFHGVLTLDRSEYSPTEQEVHIIIKQALENH